MQLPIMHLMLQYDRQFWSASGIRALGKLQQDAYASVTGVSMGCPSCRRTTDDLVAQHRATLTVMEFKGCRGLSRHNSWPVLHMPML